MAASVTEEDWLTGTDPGALLAYLARRTDDISHRKMHLFACACCRRIWPLLQDPRSRDAVAVTERYADGLATRKELATARTAAVAIARTPLGSAAETGLQRAAKAAALCASANGREAGRLASYDAATAVGDAAYFGTGGAAAHPLDFWRRAIATEQLAQALLFRDIFGNPFRPVVMAAYWLTWRSGTVAKIAEAIYNELAFDALPILADALEEAGCQNAGLLTHCRAAGAHTRGCWVLDLLLHKE